MNKQNIGFISLISIILILTIYYVTIPSNTLDLVEPTISTQSEDVSISDVSELVGLRVENDEAVLAKIDELQNIIIDKTKSVEDKNIAYEQLKSINKRKAKEEEIISIIKKEYNYDAFVKIENDQISIVIKEKNHNKELANNIIKRIQSLFKEKQYITVKFN